MQFRHWLIAGFLVLLGSSTAQAQREPTPVDSLALTPPMGWNSWNQFEWEVSDSLIREMADAMVASGMREAGYRYIIIDDYWVGGRDTKNRLFPDPVRFPNGMKAVADYVHGKGLKLGIYSDAAELTCAGVTGSLGFEELDAKSFAEWGIDYLKYDYCHAPTDRTTAFERYKKMGDALKATGRPIVYAICEWGGRSPWLWAKAAGGHLWRTTYDSRDGWRSGDGFLTGIMDIFDTQEGLEAYAGPGRWNDPDLLMVGLYGKGKSSSPDKRFAGCTDEEYKTHFALWCMLAAPLIVNNDLRTMSDFTRGLLTNRHLIGVDQDSLGRQGYTFLRSDDVQYLRKELTDGVAICIFNRSEEPKSFAFDPVRDGDILYPAEVTNAWTGRVSKKAAVRGTLPPHGCEVFIYRRK
ncbi:MAG: glycoside hydrolase family 27 protein [Rikenella sp.]|nr:glycoside hydrolase family 27 protein [Rikenella sp.]